MNSRAIQKVVLLILVLSLVFGAAKSALGQMSSTNWTGYVIDSPGVTAVSASWIVPAVHCTATGATNIVTQGLAVWIGFDGLGAAIPEQVGSMSECYNGSPMYYSWEEDPSLSPNSSTNAALPAFEQTLPDDHMTASISYLGKSEFQLVIKDLTQGESRTYTVIIANVARASAEWIVEAFTNEETQQQVTLPGFQPITFSDCSATVNNVTGSITSLNAQTITMVDNNGNTVAGTENLNQAGTSFQVAAVSPVPEFPTTALVLATALFAGLVVLKKRITHSPQDI